MFQAIWKFINYWYFRYLLVTEMYMIEKWERVAIHSALLIIFTIMGMFNMKVVLGLVKLFTDPFLGDQRGVINSEIISS